MESLLTAENAPYIWLAAGALFLALEAFGASGVGFLFAGLGAIVTAILVNYDIVDTDDTLAQFAWFFATTVVWTIILWKPMKKLRIGKDSGEKYSNIIGSSGIVTDGALEKGKGGKVKWSGTIMQAEIAEGAGVDRIEEGEIVVISDVKGTVLFVAPKKTD